MEIFQIFCHSLSLTYSILIQRTINIALKNSGTVGIMVPVSALFTIAVGRILYKRGVL